jgi:hypothetical protein
VSWRNVSEKKVATLALTVSLTTTVFFGLGHLKELHKEKVTCPQSLRTDLVNFQDVLSNTIVKVYSCSDTPQIQCDFARALLKESLIKIENINRTNEFKKYIEFEKLEKNIRSTANILTDEVPFSPNSLDLAGDSLLLSSKEIQLNLDEKINITCQPTVILFWVAVALLSIIFWSPIFFLGYLIFKD